MKLDELKAVVRAADPAAVLVAPRILGRVIQAVYRLPSAYVNLPHRKSLVVDRRFLFRHVDQEELELEPDRLLPSTVILLVRPTPEKLQLWGREATLLKFWRLLFHCNVHLALERQLGEGKLTLADLHARIDRIGQTEYDEIRAVLRQERFLPRTADERTVYVEFAAVYLELRYFLTNLRPLYFPAIRDFAALDRLLAQDVDAEALFRKTRLPGAPDPVARADDSSDEPEDFYWQLIRSARRAAKVGNNVRAAIVRTKAARVAPAALTQVTRADAQAELQRLTTRLKDALKLPDAEAAEWLAVLPALLDKADQGHWTVEARLLYDLQKACVDAEKDIFALDLVEWARSAGKRPIKRPLPSQKIVRLVKHLRSAAGRLPMTRVSDADRQRLSALLQGALHRSEERLRSRVRPILADAIHDVGLIPANPPEQTAAVKLVEELLDRLTEYGFLTFSDLRDALARNHLKLPDLTDPPDFMRGDPLLRLDRRLATALDGVYRPSEFYLRLLQRLTSLNFGTVAGRWLTRHVTLPVGGAVVALEGVQVLLDHLQHPGPIFGPLTLLSGLIWGEDAATQMAPHYPVLGVGLFVALTAFLWGLIHAAEVRRRAAAVGHGLYHGLRWLFVDLPHWVTSIPALQKLYRSWTFQLVWQYVGKPLIPCALLWYGYSDFFFGADPEAANRSGWRLLASYLVSAFLVTSPPGRALTELAAEAVLHLYQWIRADLIRGLVRLIVRIFKQLLDGLEYVLYSVDELLRFRSGDSFLSLVARVVAGLLWFPVAYVVRFYIVVLIEPCFNPLKFPVVTIATKLMLPIMPLLKNLMQEPLTPLVGDTLALAIATFTVFWSPDFFGFLFWEMKENWRLYAANRPGTLGPVLIGHHGESMVQLLRPGFHSGTLPRLFAQLRAAERRAHKTGEWRVARAYRQDLHEVEMAVRRFVEREFLELLHQSASWPDPAVRVGGVTLAGNRIGLDLEHAAYPGTRVRVAFEEQSGWLVASIAEVGWLPMLTPEQRRAFLIALLGLYHLAGVGLVREQIQGQLPPEVTAYDIADPGLVVWLNQRFGDEAVYPLDEANGALVPYRAKGEVTTPLPALDPDRLIFARQALPWRLWVEAWEKEKHGRDQTPLVTAGIQLLPEAGAGSLPLPPPPEAGEA